MDIFIGLICLLIFIRYVYVLVKYIKKKEFKKKVLKANTIGIIGYTLLTIFIINMLLIFLMAAKDKESEILLWSVFILGPLIALFYILYYFQRWDEVVELNAKEKQKERRQELETKYGDKDAYNTVETDTLIIPGDIIIEERFNKLTYILTNKQISFVHPKEYNNVEEFLANLYDKDYLKQWHPGDSVSYICENVNTLLKKNNIELTISKDDVTKDDDDFIKARRKDLFPTAAYDISKVNEIIKKETGKYQILRIQLTKGKMLKNYPIYIAIVDYAEYKKFI